MEIEIWDWTKKEPNNSQCILDHNVDDMFVEMASLLIDIFAMVADFSKPLEKRKWGYGILCLPPLDPNEECGVVSPFPAVDGQIVIDFPRWGAYSCERGQLSFGVYPFQISMKMQLLGNRAVVDFNPSIMNCFLNYHASGMQKMLLAVRNLHAKVKKRMQKHTHL